MRLIDADKLMERLADILEDYKENGITDIEVLGAVEEAMDAVCDMPTRRTMCEWISVSERLPVNGIEVLVVTKTKKGYKNIDKGYYWDGGWVHRGVSEVTHWMPIPELPKEV